MFNVVNPDKIIENYGADTLRLYEMFLGPINQSKPWDSNGIDGCFRFLRRFWNLFFDKQDNFCVETGEPTKESLKTLHKLIKKVTEDINDFSYNTSVAAFMVAVNELTQQKCNNKEVLETMVILLAPFAPHMAEELWNRMGNEGSVCDATWPTYDESKMKEDNVTLSVSFNGKTRFTLDFPVDATKEDIEKTTLESELTKKYLDGKTIVKMIVVPGRIINIVVK
jgi:leucyl-tRNA synthetase